MQVDKIKAVLALPLSLHMAYEKAKADGKIDVADVALLMDPMMKLIPAISGAKEALEQIKALDEAERADVNAWVQQTYDIAEDELEFKIEAGIDVVLSIAKLVGLLTKEEAAAIA